MAVTDDFNRTDESPLTAPWFDGGGVGQIELISNQITKTVSSGDQTWGYAGANSGDDQYSEFELISKPSNNDWGPATQVGGGIGNCAYWCSAFGSDPSNKETLKINNGSVTSLGTTSSAISVPVGAVVRCECEVNGLTQDIHYVLNTVLIDTHSDASLTGGGPGVFWYEVGGALDNWEGGDLNAVVVQDLRPDADVTTTGWSSTPLWSKIEEVSPDGVTITGTAS